jgi:hypothetical protein
MLLLNDVLLDGAVFAVLENVDFFAAVYVVSLVTWKLTLV